MYIKHLFPSVVLKIREALDFLFLKFECASVCLCVGRERPRRVAVSVSCDCL